MENCFEIEIVIRVEEVNTESLSRFKSRLQEFIIAESSEKIFINLPPDSEPVKNNIIQDILSEFGRSVYVGIAYYAFNGEIVTGFDGQPLEPFTAAVNLRLGKKYIKRKLRIIRVMDERRDMVEIKEVRLDLRQLNPIVEVLNIHIIGSASSIRSKNLLNLFRQQRERVVFRIKQ